MADSSVEITAGSGTFVDTRTEASNGHHRQVMVLGDPSTNAGVAPVDATNGLAVQIIPALPAGSNAIGKLAANSGVDIGDVDVASIAAGDNNIGNVDIVTVPADPFGANADAIVAAGAVGSIQAKLRRATQGLEDLKTMIVLAAGSAAIGKLAANSGVDIGDVDILSIAAGDNNIGNVDIVSLPAGNLGMRAMSASLSVVPASDITDATYIGDIKFGESLPAGTAAIGKLAANDGVDIGDVTVNNTVTVDTELPAAGALADGMTNPTTPLIGAVTMLYNGATVDRARGDTANGLDVDVTRQSRLTSSVSAANAADVVIASGNVPLAVLRQPINTSTTGAILVSGQANRRIRVLNGVIMAPTAVTIQLKSANNSDVTGPLPLGATGGFQIPEAEIGDFDTQVGESLTVVLSTGVQIGGWLSYVYV